VPLRERQEVEEMSRPVGVTAAKLKPAEEQLCLCLQWVRFCRGSPPGNVSYPQLPF
jgi:hypothetical protein